MSRRVTACLLPPRAATAEHRVLGTEHGLPEVDSYEIVIVHRPTAEQMVRSLAQVLTELLMVHAI